MKKQKVWTHKELCDLAVKWLKRPHGRNGHGCNVAVSEVASGWNGEIPDAIGFRCSGYRDGSVVVEVKVSRSDFLSDMKKPHRNGEALGLGSWRYYMCPEGLIQPEELPEKWGLLYVNSRGAVSAVSGPASFENFRYGCEMINDFRHERDLEREQWLLVKLFARIGDEEKAQSTLKEARSEVSRLMNKVNRLSDSLKKQNAELWKIKRKHGEAL